jgi:hypothetical protein
MRKRIIVLAGVLACVALNVMVFLWSRSGPIERSALAQVAKTPTVERESDSKAHRERARMKIREIASESIEELVEKLPDDQYIHYPGIRTGLENPEFCFEWMLTNRRVARLDAELRKLEPKQAAAIVESAFDTIFDAHRRNLDQVFRRAKDPSVPVIKGSMRATQFGLVHSLFLAFRFLEREAAFQRVAEVRTFAGQTRDLWAASEFLDDGDRMVLAMVGEPDNAFYVSLILNALPVEAGDRLLAESGLAALGDVKLVELTAWDAEPGTYDVAHTRYGIPIDNTRGMTKFRVFHWNGRNFQPFANLREPQRQLITKFLEMSRGYSDFGFRK